MTTEKKKKQLVTLKISKKKWLHWTELLNGLCSLLGSEDAAVLGDEVTAFQRSQHAAPAEGGSAAGSVPWQHIPALSLMSRAKPHCWLRLQKAGSWKQGFEHSFNAGGWEICDIVSIPRNGTTLITINPLTFPVQVTFIATNVLWW